MASNCVTVACDASSVLADLALLERAAGLSQQVRTRLVDLLDGLPDLVCVHSNDAPAVRAGDFAVRFELAQPLAELAAAVRTGEFGNFAVQDAFHG